MNDVLNSSFRFYMLIAKIVKQFCLDHSRDDQGSRRYPVNFKLEFDALAMIKDRQGILLNFKLEFDTHCTHVFILPSKEFTISNISKVFVKIT